ncbi:hypothetical protein [Janibacter sp. Soil728]|uniref:hypothetical protein n=1 Tax=Janibacter sp. Soil728 TaxID=1736393 RepID=UPI000B109C6F|nr:hypothetical protein [Janibacter sp. Soil728]
MRQDQSAARAVVVIGEGPLAAAAASMLAAAAIRREGYSLLSKGAELTSSGPGVTVAHRLARGAQGLVIATASHPLHWAQVIDRADQVVIAATTADVDSAAAKLQALHGWGGRGAALAAGAVVALSRADARHPAPSEVTARFAGLARATLVVPHDPHPLADPLQQAALPPASRVAWEGVMQVVGEDEVPEDEMDTQPRIDVRDLFAGGPAGGSAGGGPAAGAGPTPAGSWAGPPSTWGAPAPAPSPRRGRWALLAAAVAVVVALGATPFVIAGGLPWGGDTSTATPGLSPVGPVHGWTSQTAWTSPPIASGDRAPTVLFAEGTAITTTGDAASPDITALRASDGAEIWSSPVDAALTGPPQLITWKDEPAVIAATANDLFLWSDLDATGSAPTPQTWSFTETDLVLVAGSPVPLLANEDTLTALVLHDGDLRKRTLPSSGHPVAADAEGRVLSVGSAGHWWSSGDGGEVTTGTLLTPPAYGSLPGTVLGVGGTTLVVNWTRSNQTTHLVGYDVSDQMSVAWKMTVPGRVAQEDFHISPDGSWATAGTEAIDLVTGKKNQLGQNWETLRILDDRAWSRTSLTTTKGADTEPLPKPVVDPDGVPVAVTGKGLGLIVASESGGPSRIYALRPDPDA